MPDELEAIVKSEITKAFENIEEMKEILLKIKDMGMEFSYISASTSSYSKSIFLYLTGEDSEKRKFVKKLANGVEVLRDINAPTRVTFKLNNTNVYCNDYPCNYTVVCEEVKETKLIEHEEVKERKCFRVFSNGLKVLIAKGDESKEETVNL